MNWLPQKGAPHAAENVGLHVSASAVNTLQGCPRRWWYRYAEGAPEEDTSARLILGGMVHLALAVFYEALLDGSPLPPIDYLGAVMQEKVEREASSGIPILFGDLENEQTLLAEAVRLVTCFLEDGYRPPEVLGVELPFALPISYNTKGEQHQYEERLVGFIDLIARGDNGEILVIDHKTAARLDKQRAARADLQMSLYSLAVRELFNVEHVDLAFQQIVKTKTPRCVLQPIARADNDEREAIEALCSALELINVAVAHPRGKLLMGRQRSWMCKDCSYRRRCAEDRT